MNLLYHKPFNWSEPRRRKMSAREMKTWMTVVFLLWLLMWLPDGTAIRLGMGALQIALLIMVILIPRKDRWWQDGDLQEEDFHRHGPHDPPTFVTGGAVGPIEPESYTDLVNGAGPDEHANVQSFNTFPQLRNRAGTITRVEDEQGNMSYYLYEPEDGRLPFFVTRVEVGHRVDYIADDGDIVMSTDNPNSLDYGRLTEARTPVVRTSVLSASKGRNIDL